MVFWLLSQFSIFRHTTGLVRMGHKYVNTIKYLGIFLKANKIFSQDTHVLRSKFFRSLNGIYSKCSSKMSEIVLIELVRSYCLPFLTYCSESFSNDKETVAELSSCWRKAFRKIFGLPPWSSVIKFYYSLLCYHWNM